MIQPRKRAVYVALLIVLLLIPFFTSETIYAEENNPVYVSLQVAHRYEQTDNGTVLHYSLNIENLADNPVANLELVMSHTGGQAMFYPQMSSDGWRCVITQEMGEQCIWPVDEIPGHVTLGLTFALLLDDAPPDTTRRTTHVILKAPSTDGKIYSEHLHIDLLLPVRGQSQSKFYLPFIATD